MRTRIKSRLNYYCDIYFEFWSDAISIHMIEDHSGNFVHFNNSNLINISSEGLERRMGVTNNLGLDLIRGYDKLIIEDQIDMVV